MLANYNVSSNSISKKIYSIVLAILPILSLYRSLIPILSIAEVILIILIPFYCIKLIIKKNKIGTKGNVLKVQPIIFVIALFFTTLIAILILGKNEVSLNDIFYRFLRLTLWSVAIVVLGYYLFDYYILEKWLIRISLLATLYLFVQIIFWYILDIYLPSVLNNTFLTPLSIKYADSVTLINYYRDFYFRPSSFFAEPSYYSNYILLALIFSLFKKNKKNYCYPAIFTLGIILSTSTSGIYLTCIVWIYYLYSKYKKTVNRIQLYLIIIIMVIVVSIPSFLTYIKYLNNNKVLDFSFSPVEMILIKPFLFSSSARLGSSFKFFSELEIAQKFVGIGIGNEDTYLKIAGTYYNSFTAIALGSGYIGVLIFSVFIFNLFRKKTSKEFILAFVYMMGCLTGSMMYSVDSIIYLSVVYYSCVKMCKDHKYNIP